MEIEQFKDSDHQTGYFCYNCICFIKSNHCAIMTDEGPDAFDKTSGEIAPHGICALWQPNENEIHSSSRSSIHESQTNLLLMFLRPFHVKCEMCNEKFKSREELKQHTMQKHKAQYTSSK